MQQVVTIVGSVLSLKVCLVNPKYRIPNIVVFKLVRFKKYKVKRTIFSQTLVLIIWFFSSYREKYDMLYVILKRFITVLYTFANGINVVQSQHVQLQKQCQRCKHVLFWNNLTFGSVDKMLFQQLIWPITCSFCSTKHAQCNGLLITLMTGQHFADGGYS